MGDKSNLVPPSSKKRWEDFLQSTPTETHEEIADLWEFHSSYNRWELRGPDLLLYCTSEKCGGDRLFKTSETPFALSGWHHKFLIYYCRNCGGSTKTYALWLKQGASNTAGGLAYKIGEYPPFGPPTPARVITLIGPDREFFLSGRRAENHGFGIGAFAYYRRVVENQKGRIISQIGKVAQRLGASPEIVMKFEAAAVETQFSKAIEMVKSAIPSVLLVEGHNPLTLLHSALSEGIHAGTDGECLEIAQSIRIVLTDLAERISQVLKDQVELKTAVSKLLNRKNTP
jgi:hypothetical protein